MAPARVVATSPRTTEPGGGASPVAESEPQRSERDRKTGARTTAVPAPEIAPPPAAMAAGAAAPAAAAPASSAGEIRSTQSGYDSPGRASEPARRPDAIRRAPTPTGEKTEPTRLAPTRAPRQTSLLMYVGVGFTFGLALLAIYQLVGRLAH